jgi:hypothetical protein
MNACEFQAAFPNRLCAQFRKSTPPDSLSKTRRLRRRVTTAALSQRRDAPGGLQPGGGRQQCADSGSSRDDDRSVQVDLNGRSLSLHRCQPMPLLPTFLPRAAVLPLPPEPLEGAAPFSAVASSGCLCQALKTRWLVIGNTVIRLPIALKIALAMAGAITSIVGSPAPHEGVLGDCVSCSG